MGFHIVNIRHGEIESFYVENRHQLAKSDAITEDSIIYQGEKHWTPVRVGSDKQYVNYSKDWYRAGIKAQELFKNQAKLNNLMLEELSQDIDSFQQYLIDKKYIPIKRGDYLIRNFKNIEVDVKCRAFYGKENKKWFHFKCEDVERHLNMQKFTNTPILIAVYERDNDQVVESIPYFISIDKIESEKTSLIQKNVKKENTGWCFQVPLKLAVQSFDYIEETLLQL